jgi:hypothetical protein
VSLRVIAIAVEPSSGLRQSPGLHVDGAHGLGRPLCQAGHARIYVRVLPGIAGGRVSPRHQGRTHHQPAARAEAEPARAAARTRRTATAQAQRGRTDAPAYHSPGTNSAAPRNPRRRFRRDQASHRTMRRARRPQRASGHPTRPRRTKPPHTRDTPTPTTCAPGTPPAPPHDLPSCRDQDRPPSITERDRAPTPAHTVRTPAHGAMSRIASDLAKQPFRASVGSRRRRPVGC